MFIIPFTAAEASLSAAGGKGASLARLVRAGFNVPRGFIISTAAYRQFVEHNALESAIWAALAGLNADDSPAALEAASAAIRAAFAQGVIPPGLREEILQAYEGLNESAASEADRSPLKHSALPAAVRSSATTEDLPDLSFAGQQDTFLNVIGEEQLLRAVAACWSSLWTARAIDYRRRSATPHAGAALAVVVQEMVPAEAAGVLFTANPLSGLRSETVIDAVFGLGEALVSGQVEPDHYVYDTRAGRLVEQTLGARQAATRPRAGGGVETVAQPGGLPPTLNEDQVRTLAEAGQRIQAEFGAPQDIEWALAGGQLHILQSRPITSLFPIPAVSFDPLDVWVSFNSIQGIKGPITPLGRDTLIHLLTNAGKIFKVRVQPHPSSLVYEAGERLWVRLTGLLRHPLGARAYIHAVAMVEPSFGRILSGLASEPRLGFGKGKATLRSAVRLVRGLLPILARVAYGTLRPREARAALDTAVNRYLAESQVAPGASRFEHLANATAYIRERVGSGLPFMVPYIAAAFIPSMVAFVRLRRMAGSHNSQLVLEINRGLPENVTVEMDLALWEAAKAILNDADSLRLFQEAPADSLARLALEGALPPAAQAAVDRFLSRYGMRGFVEFDLGRPRWREDPTPVMHSLKSYLQIPPSQAPDALHARGAQAAEAAIEQLAGILAAQPRGHVKARKARALARRMRLGLGLRESPKFFIIRVMGIARAALLEIGAEFAQAGTIERPDDLFFFTLAELDQLARQVERDWRALAAERRAAYAREQRRRQEPRVLVSDGRAFYEGVGAETDTPSALTGSPVSPGVAEGRVRVILDPRGAQLLPGEILVCPGTDPAWTPLFMAAGGLVTEVGGMMTHGSVVAREVGIPAVVGVHQATQRLKDGQRIRLNGSTGQIELLE